MTALDNIAVHVETLPGQSGNVGNALPVLHQIRHALAALQASGQSTTIDLSAIPFGPGDKEHLLSSLGKGEVTATIDALGGTRISETAFSGVWLIEYLTPEGNSLVNHIEVTRIPTMLSTPAEDLQDSLEKLQQQLLENTTVTPGNEELS